MNLNLKMTVERSKRRSQFLSLVFITKCFNKNLLLRILRFFKSTNSYKLYGVKLSYTRCREIFKECLKEIGVDHKLYCLHSLRSGGAHLCR